MPHDVDAAILIVLHTANRAASLLPQILARVSKLPVCHPADWDPMRGRVYIAPPGFHMIVEGGVVRVVQGPRETATAQRLTLYSGRWQRHTARE
jgi:two-component system, chemotaxis family, protein-glutamate methylesterase/glutaminase